MIFMREESPLASALFVISSGTAKSVAIGHSRALRPPKAPPHQRRRQPVQTPSLKPFDATPAR